MMRKRYGNRKHSRIQSDDYFTKLRDRQGYRSRSAYKLKQIDDRERIFFEGATVVELGAAPGGWTQVVTERVGSKGSIFAIDREIIGPIKGATLIKGDCSEEKTLVLLSDKIGNRHIDLVLSDMAPRISGIGPKDEAAHSLLVDSALEFCRTFLRKNGTLVIKIFENGEVNAEIEKIRDNFSSISRRKPKASRADSNEFYVVARGYGV